MRVVRVLPDLPAVDRAFDYVLPPDLDGCAETRVGTIVRVPLHGRSVRGWVVEDDVTPATDVDRLRAVLAVVSAGPPPDVVALAAWAARRWIGPWCALLRAASPANDVSLGRARKLAAPGELRRHPPGWLLAASSDALAAASSDALAAASSDELAAPGELRRHPPGWLLAAPSAALLGQRISTSDSDSALVEGASAPLLPDGAVAASSDANIEVVEWPPGLPRFDLVAERVARAGSTIIVLPDAGRAGPLGRGLRALGHLVIEVPPGLTDKARTERWDAARQGNCIVVGGRTAIWYPVPDLVAAIILDDGDEALQEERAPTWHARDVAVHRAGMAGATTTIVSPAPTLEAVQLVGETHVRVPERRSARAGWPVVEVVDPRDDAARASLLTEAFVRAARGVLGAGGRVVCVLNRVGRARLLACAKCGELARCERCGAAVGEPTDEGATEAGSRPTILLCPQCATVRPRVCLACHGTRIKLARIGASRLRDDLAALFSDVEVAEVKRGATTVPGAPVLVGTEAVLHWAQRVEGVEHPAPVRLVAFLDFDAELLAPRARAAEQALWLLVRGARLLGGRGDGGDRRLLIQTRVAGHEVIEAARHASPELLRSPEAVRRAELGDPPFGALALLTGVPAALEVATDALAAEMTVRVLGPIEHAGVARALVRADHHDALYDAVAPAAAAARSHGRIRVSVDPARV